MRLSRLVLAIAAVAAVLVVAACGDGTRDAVDQAARARVEREIREARDDGATDAEIERLRKEARTRLDDLRDRVDDALGP
ncbi:MAG TPA: hypothetical protein VFG74_08540 [Miltoncostaeaceae bacterium]|nr:hypothetical protein [Miltoncostaeaceae bacterium]